MNGVIFFLVVAGLQGLFQAWNKPHKPTRLMEFGRRCGSLSFSLEGCTLLLIIIKTFFHLSPDCEIFSST